MTDDNNSETSSPLAQTQYKCEPCNRIFFSAPALRMHNIRKHSDKAWSTTGNLTTRRRNVVIYPSEKKEYKRRKYVEKQAQYRALGLNAHGKPFTSAYGRRLSEASRNKHGIGVPPQPKPKRQYHTRIEPFVLKAEDVTPCNPGVKFCPFCGNNIEKLL